MNSSKLTVQIIGQFVERVWCQEGCNNRGDAAEKTEHRSKSPHEAVESFTFSTDVRKLDSSSLV